MIGLAGLIGNLLVIVVTSSTHPPLPAGLPTHSTPCFLLLNTHTTSSRPSNALNALLLAPQHTHHFQQTFQPTQRLASCSLTHTPLPAGLPTHSTPCFLLVNTHTTSSRPSNPLNALLLVPQHKHHFQQTFQPTQRLASCSSTHTPLPAGFPTHSTPCFLLLNTPTTSSRPSNPLNALLLAPRNTRSARQSNRSLCRLSNSFSVEAPTVRDSVSLHLSVLVPVLTPSDQQIKINIPLVLSYTHN